MLTTELAAGEQLRTIPGENVARMKSDLALADADSFASDTLTRINTSLGSDIVVFGSYAVIGDAIRFDVRMQDARAGETVAAVAETGRENELFEIVSRIGSRLRNRLGVTELSPSQVASVQASLPSNPAAARLYAEGLAQLRLYDAQSARRSLEQAVDADPKSPLAHSALALAWSALGYDERAQQSAKRAYELSASLAREDRMWVEGRYHDAMNEHEEAIKTYQALYSFFPDNLEYGLQLASAQTAAGKGQDALGTIDSLRQLRASGQRRSAHRQRGGDCGQFTVRLQATASIRGVAPSPRDDSKAPGSWSRARSSRRETPGRNWETRPKAIAAADEARQIYASAGDRGGESRALRAAGHLVALAGRSRGCPAMYERGLAVAREIGDQSLTAVLLNNIANVLRQQGSLAAALKTYEESLAISREIGDRSSVALILNNMAIGLRVQGDLAGAKKNYLEALAIRRDIGEKAGMAATLNNLANLMSDEGDLAGAMKLYEETRQTAEEIGDKRSVAMAWFNIGEMERLQGNLSDSRTSYDQALIASPIAIEDRSAVARTLASIGMVQARAGDV